MAERGSTHHSGRVDDVLADEVEPLVRSGHESRAEDDRLHEPPADDEPLPDARIASPNRPGDGVLDLDEIEARSSLAASLRPSAFPADRDALLTVAEQQHAPPDVLEELASLPAGIRFVNVQQVWEFLGGDRERRDVGDLGVTTDIAPDIAPEDDVTIEESEIEVVLEVEIEEELEIDAETTGEPELAATSTQPWWMGAVRTGVSLATLPLRITLGALRAVRRR
ncbi:MAG: hypothetical protein QOI55_2829 [Actinomycetota bacterium]|nr:hypothetical protein [Actinomycetota bacterium]